MRYDHTQRGYLPLLFLAFAAWLFFFLWRADDESNTWGNGFMVMLMVGILGLLIVFNRLRVVVDDTTVTTAFRWGKPHRSYELADIRAVRIVRNAWWQGWGVRKIGGGWMYNVWGLDAVELDVGNDTVFRVGTDEPDRLLAALSLSIGR